MSSKAGTMLTMHGDLLRDTPADIAAHALAAAKTSEAGGPLIARVWSGNMAEDGPFAVDAAAWLPTRRGPAGQACAALCAILGSHGAGNEVWLRPHARHCVGDLAIAAAWCIADTGGAAGARGTGAATFRLMLDVPALLTRYMLEHAQDHLLRIEMAALGPMLRPKLAAVVVGNLREPDDGSESGTPLLADRLGVDEGPALECVGIDDGLIAPQLLRGLADRLHAAGVNVVTL